MKRKIILLAAFVLFAQLKSAIIVTFSLAGSKCPNYDYIGITTKNNNFKPVLNKQKNRKFGANVDDEHCYLFDNEKDMQTIINKGYKNYIKWGYTNII